MKRPRLRLRDAQKNEWYQSPHRPSVIKIRTSRQFSLEYFRQVAGNAPFAHVAGPGANPVRKGWTSCDQTCTKLLWNARGCCAPNERIESALSAGAKPGASKPLETPRITIAVVLALHPHVT